MSKRSDLRTLSFESLETRDMMSVNMSPYDQLLVELINRARANPTAEAALYGIDLNQGLSAGTISAAAKQPLAPHQSLIDAAGAHSQDMLDNDYFSHTNLSGQSPSQRAAAAGYSAGVGENIAWGGSTGPINQISHVYARHRALFESSGHRQNLMRSWFEEIGVGVRFGQYTYSGTAYNSSMVTEKFGGPGLDPILTGVVFTDAADGSSNDDDFYSIGEQVASGTITATNTSTGAEFVTDIGASGGYALQVVAGTYNVVATDGSTGLSYEVTGVVVGGDNVKVDFETTTAESAGGVAPTLDAIADVQLALLQSTWSTGLSASDPDSSQLTYSATVENLAYHLDQTLGLSDIVSVADNWGGLGEKWLRDANGSSYFITPTGELFAWDGSGAGSLSGDLVATLLPEFYVDDSLLYAAQSGMTGVTTDVTGANLSLTMDSAVRGTFVVIATVSDGVNTYSQPFQVTKGLRTVPHDPAPGPGAAVGTLRTSADVGQAWQAAALTERLATPTGNVFISQHQLSGRSLRTVAKTSGASLPAASQRDQDWLVDADHRLAHSTEQDRYLDVATRRVDSLASAGEKVNASSSLDYLLAGANAALEEALDVLDEAFASWD